MCFKTKLTTLRVGTWNVRTLLDAEDGVSSKRAERRSALVAKELKALNMDIVALTETRKDASGCLEELKQEFSIYWKGVDKGKVRNAGVGFAVRNEIVPRLVSQPVGVNERLMSLRYLSQCGTHITFICAYAPTLNDTDQAKEIFYEELQKVVDCVDKHDVIILMGDFNARVGSDYKVHAGIIGQHGLGRCNFNGELLLDFCARNNLVVTNTMFRHPRYLRGTWQHPRSKHWHMLDYIISSKKHQSMVMDTRVMRSADCSTDHRLVRSRIKITSQKRRFRHQRPKNITKKKLDVAVLKDAKRRDQFAKSMDDALGNTQIQDEKTSIEDHWAAFRDTVFETATVELGTKKNRRFDWFDENDAEIQSLVEEKRKAYAQLIGQDPKTPTGMKLKQKYNTLKADLQRQVRRLKDEWWRQRAEEIQDLHDRHNIHGMFKAINRLCGPPSRSPQTVKDLDGKILTDPQEILQRWTAHFDKLLNQFSEIDEKVLENIPQRPVDESLAAPPTLDEVKKAFERLKNNRCTGEDGIPAEVFKYGGETLLKVFHQLICRIWQTTSVPQQWKDALFIKLFKKGDPLLCGNYRGIALLAVAGKVLSNLILLRITSTVESILPESQCGFRSQRGTPDMIFAVRQLQEKCLEQRMDLFMVFIDLTKAYDTVNRELLWKLLARYGIPERLILIIRNMHEGMKAKLNLDVGMSDEIPVNNGLRQGCVKAPVLFNVFFAAVMFEAFHDVEENAGIGVRFRMAGKLWDVRHLQTKQAREEFIRELCYADDCALVSHSQEELQLFMSRVNVASKKYGLTISFQKTEVMKQATGLDSKANDEATTIELEDDWVGVLKVVDNFTYLGSTMSNDVSLDKEISKRLNKAGTSFCNLWHRVWKPGGISLPTKMAVYRACVLSVLLYGAQTWNTYRRHIRRLETFHHRCLRKILNISWQEHVPTTEILRKAQLPSIDTMIVTARIKWLGHVRRMPDHRYPKILLMSELSEGKRQHSKPKQRWKDKVKEDLLKVNITPKSWWTSAENRVKWRKSIHNGAVRLEQRKNAELEAKRSLRKMREAKEAQILRREDGFKCTHCTRVFPKVSSMRRHVTMSHTDRPELQFLCPNCQRSFSTASARTRHKCTLIVPTTLSCPTCGKTCKNKSGLTRHMKKCQDE